MVVWLIGVAFCGWCGGLAWNVWDMLQSRGVYRSSYRNLMGNDGTGTKDMHRMKPKEYAIGRDFMVRTYFKNGVRCRCFNRKISDVWFRVSLVLYCAMQRYLTVVNSRPMPRSRRTYSRFRPIIRPGIIGV